MGNSDGLVDAGCVSGMCQGLVDAGGGARSLSTFVVVGGVRVGGDSGTARSSPSLSCAFMNHSRFFKTRCLVLCSLFSRVESTSQGCPLAVHVVFHKMERTDRPSAVGEVVRR